MIVDKLPSAAFTVVSKRREDQINSMLMIGIDTRDETRRITNELWESLQKRLYFYFTET